jgi:hypothetical protein
VEQLVLLLIFLLVGLANAILRWRQQAGRAPAPETEPAPPVPRELPPRARVPVPLPPPLAVAPAVPRPAPPAPSLPPRPAARSRPHPVHRWLGSPAAVRQAMVAVVVLGPCRALEREPGVGTPGPNVN